MIVEGLAASTLRVGQRVKFRTADDDFGGEGVVLAGPIVGSDGVAWVEIWPVGHRPISLPFDLLVWE